MKYLNPKQQRIYEAISGLASSPYEQKILHDIALVADDADDARALYAQSRQARELPALEQRS